MASYEAVGLDDRGCKHLYSINVLDGTILVDGFPPERLPREVTEHPMYLRTFGRVDFEVFRTEQGVLVTTRAVNGRHYEFTLSAGCAGSLAGELKIVEVDSLFSERLELLDAGEGHQCAGWGEQLPVRLRQLHSHWLSREHGVIILRPPEFLKHSTEYLISVTASSTSPPSEKSSYCCWHVPSHLQGEHWLQLLKQQPPELVQQHLVLQDEYSHLLQVLSKMEDKQFIHAYQCISQHKAASDGAAGESYPLMLFELPRFCLKFSLHSNGVLASEDFKGYRLHECQQLVQQASDGSTHYTLADFQQYLVLQRSPELSTGFVPGSGKADVLVLVPAGQIQPLWSRSGKVSVMTKRFKFHTYERHSRFRYLQASSIESRLQLAALYAATSSLLPEPVSQQTGVETAMQLVRHSWTNQPLKSSEAMHLRSVSAIGGHLAPALRLLANEMEASACQLQHLHVCNTTVHATAACPPLDPDAAAEYRQLASSVLPGGWGFPYRHLLTPLEEQRILHTGRRGISTSCSSTPRWLREHGTIVLSNVPSCPVKADYICETEGSLKRLVVEPEPAGASVPPYPLKYDVDDSVPLRKEMHQELEESWRDYHSSPAPSELMSGAKEIVTNLQLDVSQKRQQAEDHVMNILSQVSVEHNGQAGNCFTLLRSSGTSPTLGVRDLMACAVWPQLVQEHNPFLSEASRDVVHSAILIWAQLCVLEDRLHRLVNLFAAGEDTYKAVIIRELLVERIWDPFQHPQWLVFEVEGQLQIRPDQYHHAKELLAHTKDSAEPGPITQLNMGEGKTRVILPMLALAWADQSCVIRLNFLSPLLSMSYQHLHNTLTASVLNVRLFTMPFHRDVQVTEQGAHAMLGTLAYCRQVGGLLLVAPEHRLSLYLKSIELWGRDEHSLFHKLQQILAFAYQDILDESDELLHHRLQLVYACGTPQSLPALQERCAAIQALLRLVSDMADTASSPELTTEGVATWTPSFNRAPGSFCQLQLLSGPTLESVTSDLHNRLAEELIKKPPYEMRWLATLGKAKVELLQCVTDPAASAQQILEKADSLLSQVTHKQQDLTDQVMVIRGLLACDLLQHALLKRHRVHYGVSRSPGRKRIAIPFRAADTPSPRSEFAQPDVALLLTHLSYYYDGLTLEEFKEALLKLLQMGPSAQEELYQQWLQLSQMRIKSEHKPVFDDVRKLDPTNSQQLQLMHSYMSHNMAVINFWLSYCVLPKETVQYPKRLVATSWNLADNADGRIVGFSGTNDNHRLLPAQVSQRVLSEQPHLSGTNGKMMACLLELAEYRTLHRPTAVQQAEYKPDWQLLLDAALQQKGSAGRTGVEALLDCGALLAGIETRDAAHYILQHMPGSRYQGVCFYDPKTRQWTVTDRLGRMTPLHQSPVAEADCFVIYDDARCRGADLKLNQQAVGLLTLAPGMCKDKMMQAAGRMRQLGRGQTLVVMGLQDVTDKVYEATVAAGNSFIKHFKPGMRDVLQWVMDNTVQSTQHGVVEHATQGMQFAVTKGAPDRALLDEKLLPADFYGSSKARQPAVKVLQAAANKSRLQLQQPGNEASAASSDAVTSNERLSMADADREAVIEKVLTVSTAHGQGYSVVAGQGADEECERELEEEEEEEKEEEKEVPRVTAAAETDWEYSAAFAAASVQELVQAKPGAGFHVLSLPEVAQHLGPGFKDFDWSAKVFCTLNFKNTVHQAASTAKTATGNGLGPYQRYLDALLVFASGDVLLLTDREAEGLQETVWSRTATCTSCSPPPTLLSLCYAQQVLRHGSSSPLLLAAPLQHVHSSKGGWIGSESSGTTPQQSAKLLLKHLGQTEAVHMRFFNGSASQYSVEQQQLLHQLVKGKREEAKDVLAMRDQLAMFARSDLELACDF